VGGEGKFTGGEQDTRKRNVSCCSSAAHTAEAWVLLSELHSLTSAQASFCLYRRSTDYLFAITIKTRHCNAFFSVHFAS